MNKDNNKKKIIITGVTGQDGSLMVNYLLQNTLYDIYGTVRDFNNYNDTNIKHINCDRFHLIELNLNLNNTHNIYSIIEEIKPDYFINFAAQSNVACSLDLSKYTMETNTLPIIDILEAIIKFCPKCKFYNAGSSEEFGNIIYTPQDEHHPLKPLSPYAASKVGARQIINVYRETYKIYAIQGWLFNHEGTRRNEKFVTRKITKKIADIYSSLKNNIAIIPLELGNIYSSRDWSDAEDFMNGVWLMLNQDEYDKYYNGTPKEYVLSSDVTHTIKEFVETAFKYININGYWKNNTNENINDKYYYINNNNEEILLVTINPEYYRKCDLNITCGNSSKIKYELGWEPKITFEELVKKMVIYDIELQNKKSL